MRFALDHPELVRSLVLVGTASECNARAHAWYESLADTRGARGRRRGRSKKLGARDETADARPSRRGFARVARAMATLAHRAAHAPSSSAYGCPALVVVGEKDFLGVGGSVIISRRIAGSRLEIVPERGHAIFHEDPAAFNARLLVGFFDGAARAGDA